MQWRTWIYKVSMDPNEKEHNVSLKVYWRTLTLKWVSMKNIGGQEKKHMFPSTIAHKLTISA